MLRWISGWIQEKDPKEFIAYWVLRWRLWISSFTDHEEMEDDYLPDWL